MRNRRRATDDVRGPLGLGLGLFGLALILLGEDIPAVLLLAAGAVMLYSSFTR